QACSRCSTGSFPRRVRPRRRTARLNRRGIDEAVAPRGPASAVHSVGEHPVPDRWRRTMTLRSRLFAMTHDRQLAKVEKGGLGTLRKELLAGASGDVLEIGTGTGANLLHYPATVSTLTLTEPESPMVRRLERRVRELASPARIFRAPAEDLPFEDDSFDVAVSTLVLCGVSDQPRALRELRRGLRPGGPLPVLQHVRPPHPPVPPPPRPLD